MKESQIQSAIIDYLVARHILCFRMNTGAMRGEHNGKKWFMRFGSPGMADILAFHLITGLMIGERTGENYATITRIEPLWIEVKTEKGKQSDLQKAFQDIVEENGHKYIVARSVDDVVAALG